MFLLLGTDWPSTLSFLLLPFLLDKYTKTAESITCFRRLGLLFYQYIIYLFLLLPKLKPLRFLFITRSSCLVHIPFFLLLLV